MSKTLAVPTVMLALVIATGARAQTGQGTQAPSAWSTPSASTKAPGKPSKPCPRYGEGFYQVPGTDTCVKIDGYVRSDVFVPVR